MGTLLQASQIMIKIEGNYGEYFAEMSKIHKSFCAELDSSRQALSVLYSADFTPWAHIRAQVLEMDRNVLSGPITLAAPPDTTQEIEHAAVKKGSFS